MAHPTHKVHHAPRKPSASALRQAASIIANSLRGLWLEVKFSLRMWLQPLLRIVLKPPIITILDSSVRSGQFLPLDSTQPDPSRGVSGQERLRRAHHSQAPLGRRGSTRHR